MPIQPGLFKADTNKKHTHIAYIRPDGSGITTKNQGHEHQIIVKQSDKTIVNEMGETVSQSEPFSYIQEVEGHNHVIIPFEKVEKKRKRDVG